MKPSGHTAVMAQRTTYRRTVRRRVDDAKLKKFWNSGLSDYELEYHMRHSINTLRNRARVLGLPKRQGARIAR